MLKKSYLVFILILLYFTIPKIDLFSLPGIPTGVRFQDLISFFIFIILINFRLEIKSYYLYLLLIFIFFQFIYSILIWNSYVSIIGIIRIYEYFIVAKGLFFIINKGFWSKFYKIIFTYLFIFSIGQYFKLIPVFDPGRGIIYTNDFAGSFGNSAELSYFVIVLLYLAFVIQNLKLTSLITSSLILLNGVKASVLGIGLLFIFKIKKINFFQIIFIFLIIIILAYNYYDSLLLATEFIYKVFEKATNEKASFDSLKTGTRGEIDELSLGARLGKWGNSLSLLLQYPLGLLFGFGIYSQGGALDGGILRIIYEIGLIASISILIHLYSKSISFFFIVISVSLFFDSYMSSVVMPLLICTYLVLIKGKP